MEECRALCCRLSALMARRLAALTFTSLLTILALDTPPAWGDVFELKDGRKIEGTIIRELGDLVSIKTANEIITLERSEIVKQKQSQTQYDEYLARKKKLTDDDAAGQQDLARWCYRQGLEKEAIVHFKALLRVDPNNEEARRVLGYEWIAGDWYLKDSREAARRRKEIEDLEFPPLELTKQKMTQPKVKPLPTVRRLPSLVGAPQVHLKIDEVVGRGKPELSLATHRVANYFADLDEPLHVIQGGEAQVGDYQLKIKIRVYFVRTHMFYGKIPITNIFKGEAQVTLQRIDAAGAKSVMILKRIKQPFSASTQLEKVDAYTYAYYDLVQRILYRLSQQSFLKKRGAKLMPAPPQ